MRGDRGGEFSIGLAKIFLPPQVAHGLFAANFTSAKSTVSSDFGTAALSVGRLGFVLGGKLGANHAVERSSNIAKFASLAALPLGRGGG